MQSLRFTHIYFTSMKRGLAMVKLWILKSVVLLRLRSIPRNIIKHVLVAARDEICKVLGFHTVASHL